MLARAAPAQLRRPGRPHASSVTDPGPPRPSSPFACAGTFGRVFRGQYRGETVAVKVVDFPLFNKQAAAEVSRECQHALSCVHPSIVRCLTFHTVTVRTHLRRGVPLRCAWEGGRRAACSLRAPCFSCSRAFS